MLESVFCFVDSSWWDGSRRLTGEAVEDASGLAALLFHVGWPPALAADEVGRLVKGPADLCADRVQMLVEAAGSLRAGRRSGGGHVGRDVAQGRRGARGGGLGICGRVVGEICGAGDGVDRALA